MEGAYTLLISTYKHNVDAKGRVFIPARWRNDLGDIIIVYRGIIKPDDVKCLFGMSLDEWTKFSQKLQSLSLGKMDAQRLIRKIFSGASECEVDKTGRILLPQTLREYAGIEEEVVLNGMGKRIEIWNPAMYEYHDSLGDELSDSALDALMELGV